MLLVVLLAPIGSGLLNNLQIEEGNMQIRPVQVSLRRILVAVFWICVALAAWVVEVDTIPHPSEAFVLAVFTLRIVPLFIAVGTLFRKPWIGALIGWLVWTVILAVLSAFPRQLP